MPFIFLSCLHLRLFIYPNFRLLRQATGSQKWDNGWCSYHFWQWLGVRNTRNIHSDYSVWTVSIFPLQSLAKEKTWRSICSSAKIVWRGRWAWAWAWPSGLNVCWARYFLCIKVRIISLVLVHTYLYFNFYL